MNAPTTRFQENRRSTRVPLDVTLKLSGAGVSVEGVTVVVNLHGALIRVAKALSLGSQIEVTVYITGKTATARVVFVAHDNPLTCGIELDRPQNIWGVSLAPDDWDEGQA
jgi:hypothetical protein